ncbi:hypothetical protein GPECTOR_11g120 [Gonium pectorale]|uniref:Ankyrin repeat domain-containing protein n=1 Tax=Gonium pectorale TaxID=33097 RepID=A0A150GPK9_GONPE|nr:hypothetical protein GPECTOR_11g120 [Gonium pectorale]|eukprot:KXZ51668.1 hypothetical protein GPECTOR_11g120 [Gonium pectorale]
MGDVAEEPHSPSASRVWIPTVLERVAAFLPANEVACTLRLVDKATAEQFRRPEFGTVRLSQPVPPHAFTWRWGRPGAACGLTVAKRWQLLSLTAASGSVFNLQTAISAAGCKTDRIAYAAGRAGHLGMCLLLADLGYNLGEAVEGAAAAGRLALCVDLLQRRALHTDFDQCAKLAAANGHVEVLDYMVQRAALERGGMRAWQLLLSVAQGCDLATLQRCVREWVDSPAAAEASVVPPPEGVAAVAGPAVAVVAPHADVAAAVVAVEVPPAEAAGVAADAAAEEARTQMGRYVVAAAAGSPTPDWQAKVEWLEGRRFPRTEDAITEAAEQPNALERCMWLRQRGYPVAADGGPFMRPAEQSDFATLECLARLGCPWGPPGQLFERCVGCASCPLPSLAWLVEVGCPVDWATALKAAEERAAGEGASEAAGAVLAWVRWQAGRGLGL